MKYHTLIILFCSIAGSLVQCAESPEPFKETGEVVCAAHDGGCTDSPGEICGAGQEPLTADDAFNTDCLGNCCVAAPSSICSSSANMNCIPDECSGSWRPVSGNTPCEEGRTCCFWND